VGSVQVPPVVYLFVQAVVGMLQGAFGAVPRADCSSSASQAEAWSRATVQARALGMLVPARIEE
jgi:hypothetical protein